MLTLAISVSLFLAAGVYIMVSAWQRHRLLAREQSIEYMQLQVSQTLEAWHDGVVEAGQVKRQLGQEFAQLLRGKHPPPVGRMTFVTCGSSSMAGLMKALYDVPVVALRSSGDADKTLVYVMFRCASHAELLKHLVAVVEAGFAPHSYSFGC